MVWQNAVLQDFLCFYRIRVPKGSDSNWDVHCAESNFQISSRGFAELANTDLRFCKAWDRGVGHMPIDGDVA